MSGILRSKPKLLISLLFLITGVFWVTTAMSSESSPYTIGVGILSLISGIVIFMNKVTGLGWSICLATAFYNLVIFAYLIYASTILVASGLTLQGWISTIGYLLATVIYLLMIMTTLSKPSYLSSNPEGEGKDGKV
jgi:hypothetical protein